MDLTQGSASGYENSDNSYPIKSESSIVLNPSFPTKSTDQPASPSANRYDSEQLHDTPTKRIKTECVPPQSSALNADVMSDDSVGAASGYTHKMKRTWLHRHTIDGAVEEQSLNATFPTEDKSEHVNSTDLTVAPTSIEDIDASINSVVEGTRENNRMEITTSADCKNSSISSIIGSVTVPANVNKSHVPRNVSTTTNNENTKSQTVKTPKTEAVTTDNGASSIDTQSSPAPTTKLQRKKSAPSVATQIRKKLISQRPSLATLKRTGASFVQHLFCSRYDRVNRLPRCRECRVKPGALEDLWSDGGWSSSSSSSSSSSLTASSAAVAEDDGENIYCRFVAFRKLRYTRSGLLVVAGFCDPVQDADDEDRRLWLPRSSTLKSLRPPTAYRRQLARLMLRHVGAQFCRLVEQEEEAVASTASSDVVSASGTDASKTAPSFAWKRVVPGCREMCDVCETTLFNTHWVCGKCGFAMCPDCYMIWRKSTTASGDEPASMGPGQALQWLPCNNRQNHTPERMMLTCIIAGDALQTLNRRVHSARRQAGLAACHCAEAQRQEIGAPLAPALGPEVGPELGDGYSSSDSDGDSGNDCDDGNALRQLLGVAVNTSSDPPNPSSSLPLHPASLPPVTGALPDRLTSAESPGGESCSDAETSCGDRVRVMTLTESRQRFPLVPHSWLCDGKLLLLEDGGAPAVTASAALQTSATTSAAVDGEQQQRERLFRDQWRCGQPVLCSGVGRRLQRQQLWTVEAFMEQFGHLRHDLINCTTGNVVPGQLMRDFWRGFGCVANRLRDDSGQPMILKLKDWPPGEDFSDLMPSRFADLMRALPMPEYTRRDGRLNLASCLPSAFVPPDLGPKMYIAYGCAHRPDRASTNLHLDVSDAVNIIVHVAIPDDEHECGGRAAALAAIDEAGCGPLTKRRARENRPGALWHIYRAADADRIRDLLNRVALERGDRLEARHDPIHDQSWYLDGPLRQRLYAEYGVEGFPIVQCSGDALFVPAGAPHQVRNLHSCIKVAEDFVSPENVGHCFDLTQEFRSLSDTHTNHEDKLQIKNIVYHAMKEVVSYWPE